MIVVGGKVFTSSLFSSLPFSFSLILSFFWICTDCILAVVMEILLYIYFVF